MLHVRSEYLNGLFFKGKVDLAHLHSGIITKKSSLQDADTDGLELCPSSAQQSQ